MNLKMKCSSSLSYRQQLRFLSGLVQERAFFMVMDADLIPLALIYTIAWCHQDCFKRIIFCKFCDNYCKALGIDFVFST